VGYFYDFGSIARSNDTFNKIDVKAITLTATRTHHFPDRSNRVPNTKEMQNIIASSSIDPLQTRTVCNRFLPRETLTEWVKSMAFFISHISNCFENLPLYGRDVNNNLRCNPSIVKMFHNILRSIDPDYEEFKRAASQLPKMPLLETFIDEHVVSTPYSFSILKCCK